MESPPPKEGHENLKAVENPKDSLVPHGLPLIHGVPETEIILDRKSAEFTTKPIKYGHQHTTKTTTKTTYQKTLKWTHFHFLPYISKAKVGLTPFNSKKVNSSTLAFPVPLSSRLKLSHACEARAVGGFTARPRWLFKDLKNSCWRFFIVFESLKNPVKVSHLTSILIGFRFYRMDPSWHQNNM